MPGRERLASALEAALGSPVAVIAAGRVTAGARRQNLVVDVTVRGVERRLVVTIVPTGESMVNSIEAEAAVIRCAGRAGVVAPRVLFATDATDDLDGPFMVTEFVAGETVPRQILRLAAQPAHAALGTRVVTEIGTSLARLHQIPLDEAPAGVRRNPPGSPLDAAVEALRRDLDALPLPRPALELGLRWLRSRLPPPPSRGAIVHSDVRTGNIVVDADGLRAILDWEAALVGGDPMQDLAWTTLRMWRFRNDHLEVGGLAPVDALIDGYTNAGGTFDQRRFAWWKIAETLRWAIGLAAQTEAVLRGDVDSIVQAASGRRVSELEWDLLCQLVT